MANESLIEYGERSPAASTRGLRRWVQPAWRDALRRRLLLGADVLAWIVAYSALAMNIPGVLGTTALTLPLWLILGKLFGLYDLDHRVLRHLTIDESPTIFLWALATTAGMALLESLYGTSLDAAAAIRFCVVLTVGAVALRGAARTLWRRIAPAESTLIMGAGQLADATKRKLELFPDIHVKVIAERDDLSLEMLRTQLGWLDGVDRVIVATDSITEDLIAALVVACRRGGQKLSIIPPARGMFGTAVKLNHVADLAVVEYNTWNVSPSTLAVKRALDILVASIAIVVLLPVAIVIAIAIKMNDRGPVFFVQQRAGRLGVPFPMIKFRTMRTTAEDELRTMISLDELSEPMFKFKRDPRVTRPGRFLRRWSLDELPQLVNVFLGHMSLVGPRPEQVDLVERYIPEHRFRLEVKPGITGPMQVYGRGALTFTERLAVEREYIENLSLGRDLHIIAMTIAPLFTGRGAY
jgi:exopolysaccharide biosynthesis polyprenyl glycosylphosphotransferase